MKVTMLACAAIMLGAMPAITMAAPIVPGQVDTFQSLTTDGWFAGGGPAGGVPPVPPTAIPTGGPGGVGDAYLQITSSGGNGPGSRLVAMNTAQWAGDYSAIGSIEMDLINPGPTTLTIRLLFEDPVLGPPSNVAVTTAGAVLNAGSGWTHFVFDIAAADLTPLMGTANAVIGHTTLLRIIHAATAGDAEPILGMLGVDNIRANAAPLQAVPEPATILLLASGLAAGAARRRQRRSQRGTDTVPR